MGVICYAMLLIIRPSPWWHAQYFIPTLGMLLGNCISGVSVGLSSIMEELTTGWLLTGLQVLPVSKAGSPVSSECLLAFVQGLLRVVVACHVYLSECVHCIQTHYCAINT